MHEIINIISCDFSDGPDSHKWKDMIVNVAFIIEHGHWPVVRALILNQKTLPRSVATVGEGLGDAGEQDHFKQPSSNSRPQNRGRIIEHTACRLMQYQFVA